MIELEWLSCLGRAFWVGSFEVGLVHVFDSCDQSVIEVRLNLYLEQCILKNVFENAFKSPEKASETVLRQ